jgi:2-phospho-L-lactate/phosphoenolpyruvate guanylyltransferase
MATSNNPLWAVVPVKSMAQAKQRLAGVLAPHERPALARAMLQDVLAALTASACLAGTLVVTNDAAAIAIARGAGADVLTDAPDAGLVPALEHAAHVLAERGREGMLIVPADVPLITPQDIAHIAQRHRGHANTEAAVTLVYASHDGGTNALACSPPDALPLRYGPDSFRLHVQAARALGLTPDVLHMPRFGRDIDGPADLRALLADPCAADTRTHAWLHASGVARRLAEPAFPPTSAAPARRQPETTAP